MSRHFVRIDNKTGQHFGQHFGRYCGNTPKQAATKCASKLFQKIEISGGNINNKINFVIREITRNSEKKFYAYEAKRTTCIHTAHIGNKIITYKYITKLKKIKLHDIFNTKIKNPDTPIQKPIDILPPKIMDVSVNTLIIEI